MKHYNFEHTQDKLPPDTGIGWLLNNKILDLLITLTPLNRSTPTPFESIQISSEKISIEKKDLGDEKRCQMIQKNRIPC